MDITAVRVSALPSAARRHSNGHNNDCTKGVAMHCPKCGYAMSTTDLECPRCVRYAGQSPTTPEKVRAQDHPGYTALTVVALLIPLVGLIAMIVFFLKGTKLDAAMGVHLLLTAIFGIIISIVLFGAIWSGYV
jgi:hypothetical protein